MIEKFNIAGPYIWHWLLELIIVLLSIVFFAIYMWKKNLNVLRNTTFLIAINQFFIALSTLQYIKTFLQDIVRDAKLYADYPLKTFINVDKLSHVFTFTNWESNLNLLNFILLIFFFIVYHYQVNKIIKNVDSN